MDRPLAALALLLGVIALSLTVVGMGELVPQGPGGGRGAAELDDLASGIGRVETECEIIEKDREALAADIDELAADLAKIRKGSSGDRASIGRLAEEALRARGLRFKGDPEPEKKKPEPTPAEPKAAAPRKPLASTGTAAKLAAATEAAQKEAAKLAAFKKAIEAKKRAAEQKAKKKAAARKPSPLQLLHKRQGKELMALGLIDREAFRVVEALEAGRRMTLEALRKHRADKNALAEARKRIDARVDGEVKAFLDPDEYKIYLEWRARLKGATETIKAKRERPDEDDR